MKYTANTDEQKDMIKQELIQIKDDYTAIPWIIVNKNNEYSLDVNILSGYIKKNANFLFVRNQATDRTMIYLYKNGVYSNVSDDEIMAYIKDYIPQMLMNSKSVREIFFDLTKQNKFVRVSDLDDYENLINFQDGLYDIENDRLIEHSPDIYSTIQIPANYEEIKNTDEASPVFDKYLETLCGTKNENGEIEKNPDKEFLLLQYIGLSISNYYGYRTKQALFLEGKGDSGKSQIKALVEYLLGDGHFSTISLQKLSERFGTSALYQKRLVGCNDMENESIKDISVFKELTGGDNVLVEFKHSASFDYVYRGVLWFNCNNMPLFYGDKGKWVYDRIINIKCDNSIPREKQDKQLLSKMKKEKNAIIKKALDALKVLINNNFEFIDLPEVKINRAKFKIRNSTFLSFISDCCIVSSNKEDLSKARTPRKILKEAYSYYVKFNYENKALTLWKDCNKILEEEFNCKTIKSHGTMCLTNIKIKAEAIRDFYYIDESKIKQIEAMEKLEEIEKDKILEDKKKQQEEKLKEKQKMVDIVNGYKGTDYTQDDLFMTTKLPWEEQ